MKTKALALKLMMALFAGSALLVASAPAEARHDRHDQREWRSDFRGSGHAHARGHYRYKQPKQVVVKRRPVRSTVVVREHYYYAPPPAYYYAPPPPRYGYHPGPVYSRDPAIVIGISVPPIVIPIR